MKFLPLILLLGFGCTTQEQPSDMEEIGDYVKQHKPTGLYVFDLGKWEEENKKPALGDFGFGKK